MLMNFGKSLLLSALLSLFTVGNLFAADFYWVGNSGNWSDATHWSNTSGGAGGIGVPSANDDVIFDINSFTTSNSLVDIQTNISFHNLKIIESNKGFIIKSNTNITINIHGDLDVPKVFNNQIEGDIHFKSNTSNSLNFGWGNWNSNIYFEGKDYLFTSPLTNPNKSVSLISGGIDLNGNDLRCGSFISNSNKKREIKSANSTIIIHNQWITKPSKFIHDFNLSKIHSLNANFNAIDKGGDSFQINQSTGSNAETVTVVSIITDTASCGDLCDGMIIVNFTTTCPNAFVNWSPGTPSGDDNGLNPITTGSDTIFNLCPGIEYTAVVTNDCDANAVFPKATVLGHSLITLPIPPIITATSCNGICDGAITAFIDAAGFTLPYLSYQWTPGGPADTNTTYTGLCAGPYDLQVLDGFGCDTTFTITVTEPDSVYANVTVTNPSCFGACIGSATSAPSGGTAPYFYSWTPPTGNPALDTVATFNNLCDGVPYTVTVTDAEGCSNDTTITPVEPPQMQFDTVSQNVSCGGACDGQITVTVLSGGVGPFTHNWSNGFSSVGNISTNINLCAGPYCDTITDFNGCDTVICFVIGQPDTLITTTVFTDLTCNGICDGTATTTATGGAVGTYVYIWTPDPGIINGQGTDSIFNLCPGQYNVLITDINNCTVEDSVTISEPPPLVVNPSSTNITCPGFDDGTATCNPTGGTGNPAVDFTYSWTGPACSAAPYATQSISSLCPGTYIVTVTDSSGCTAIDSVIISEPPAINLVMNFTNETCFGACDGTAGATVTGGTGDPAVDFTYIWTSVPVANMLTASGQGTDSIFNLCAGDYTINVTDSVGCPANATVTITPVTAIVDNIVTTDLTCNGVCNGTATISPTGGTPNYTISWDGAPDGPPILPGGSETISNLCAGPHTALITDGNGCTLPVNFVINEPPPLTTSTATNDISCFGACDGDATTSPLGGVAPYTYVWNAITGSGPVFPFIGDPINTLCAGTYYVTVSDDSLCTVNDTIEIFEPLEIFPNATFTNITCNGLNNGTAVSLPTGGVPGYTFSWTGPGAFTSTSQSINSLLPGQYIITVTDTNGCTGVDTVVIIDPPALTVSAAATAASCGTVCDGAALATPTGGTGDPLVDFTYSWTGPGCAPCVGNPITGLCAGTYTVTVSDSNLCTAQDTTVIANIVVIGINTTAVGLSCNGTCDGTATAVPSGGLAPYTFQWNGNSTVATDTLISVGGLCPGWVYVTVCDANGCCSTDSVNMPIAPPVLFPNGQIDQYVSCFGACDAMVSHNPTGGTPPYTSVWTLPNGIDTNNVCPPFAVITITDAAGCIQSDTLIIPEPTPIIPNDIVVDVLCNGDSTGSITLAPTGGTGGVYTYVWTGPMPGSGMSTTGLMAGIYTITVTDSNGCSILVTDTIDQPPVFSTIPIAIDVSCFGACDGIMAVVPNGGVPPYTYFWSPNGQITDSIFGLCSPPIANLTNSVTVTDSNLCISSQTIVITEALQLFANVTGTPEGCTTTCDGTALATPSGGTAPYSYSWSANAAPNPLNGASISNLCPGSYTVTVTDTNGCIDTATYTVTTPVGLAVTLDSTNVTCNSLCNGTGTATPTGGTAPFSYSWVGTGLNPATDTLSNVSGLCPGTYTVTVIDSNGCIFIGSINITEPQPIDDNEVIIGANCGVADGSICMFPSGGTPPYFHSWSNGNTTSCITNLAAGFYTDTITDAQGCVEIFTIGVTNPIGPSGVAATVNDATCNGVCDGSFNVIPIGGIAPFTFAWTGPAGFTGTDSTETGLCAGTYNLILTEVGTACILTTSVVIGEADSISGNPNFTDATCNGVCDGTASVSPTGGTSPYTYVWSSNGSTSSSISGLCTGPVSVTITDDNGCTNVVNFNIGSPNALTITSTPVDPLCNGSCDGTITANPAGGTGPYTYQWNDPAFQTSQMAIALCAGTYIVTVTDLNGCAGNDTVTLNDPTIIIDNAVTTNSSCGNADGTASVVASAGGTGAHTYSWPTLGASTPGVSGLAAGTYPVIICDANLCCETFLITISDANGPAVSVATVNASCNGVCDGQATASVTSGNPNYTFLWTTPTAPPAAQPTTPTITGLCAGNYSVEVTDGNGCVTTQPVTISDNLAITASVSTIDASCNGACDGSALVVPNGGVPPYAYSWTGGNAAGQTINAVGGLCAGNYTVTITDAIGCSLPVNVTINEANILTVSIAGIAANCPGSCDGSATANPVGGTGPYTYSWSTNASTPTITALCAGSYSVTVTDANGCTANANINIGDGVAITATINTVDATCGLCDGSITVAGGGGSGGPYTYLWTINGLTTPTLTNLCPGAYNVDITDNVGCTQSFNILINNANGPTLTTLADSVSCFGACDGMAYTNVTAGIPNYIYQWDDPLLQIDDSATALCAGLYNVIVQDSLGCITVDSITVPEPQELLANMTFTDPTCPGACDGTAMITPTGGVGPYTVSWNGGGGINVAIGASDSISGLCAGTHYALITDNNGCTVLDSVILTDPTPITITISSTLPTCAGDCDGTAIANASGGTAPYSYSWNTVPVQNNSLIGGLCAGTYLVTVTDNNGCTDTASVLVVDSPVLTTTSTPNALTCSGVCDGSITTTPNGGVPPYTYIWSNGDTSQTTVNTLCAGVYDVIVVDANNCTAYDTITLVAAPILNDSTVVTGPSCGVCDGSATSTPVGGVGPFDFVWTSTVNPFPVLQTDLGAASSTIPGLCAGTIDLEITDQGTGCVYNYTIIVNSITGPTLVLASTDETCISACDGTATVTPSGGTSPYTYSWTPTGPPTDTNQTATGLCAGPYTVTVTDSNGCITSDTLSINTSSISLSITSIVPETCFGDCDGSATVAVSGGTPNYTYSWIPTAPVQTTPQATGLCIGNYVVTVTDSLLCSDSISANISGPSELIVSANENSPISCFGICDGAAIANVNGGTPNYTYLWDDPTGQTTQIATNLCAGTYIVIITDDNGCTATDTVTLTEPSAILDNSIIILPACGVCDGSITTVPTGGVGPYTFLWTTPTAPPAPQPVTAAINNLCAGAYTVAITDLSGCTANFAYPLSNANAPIPNTTVTNISCNGVCDGSINSAPTGGILPYSYFWNFTGDTTQNISGLCVGQYSLEVTDSAGCVGVAIDSVTEPAVLQANLTATNLNCSGVCDGTVATNVSGGTPNYTFSWTGTVGGPYPTDSTLISLCAGTYYVTVTDNNTCTVLDSITISEPTTITATSTQVDATCTSNCDGSATITPAGGIGPYTFEWNGNATPGQPATQTGLCFGLNLVIITDQNGCSIIDSVNIGATDTVLADAGLDTIICLNETAILNGIPLGTFTGVEWFELPSMNSLGTTNSISVTPTASGVFCYAFQVTGACSYTDTVCVTVDPLPIANAGPDVTIFEHTSTTLNATGGSIYSWTPGGTLSDSTISNPVATPTITTTYYVTVTSSNGCTATDTVTVTVLPGIVFPDGITPNGDGKNDVWIIDFIEQYPNNMVEIYNRWGELLFHADGYLQDWNGTYNGKELPIGTYYYIIDLNEESIRPFTGPLTILR